MNRDNQPKVRRKIAFVGAWNTLLLDRRSPYTVTFWSIACAGLGHILLDKYFQGFILLTGEIAFNFLSNLNTAIFYTLIGQFDKATQILDIRWMLLYFAVYCFSIFDSYRETIEINNTYILAAREDSGVGCFAINSAAFSHINTVPPLYASVYSAILPGSGCFLLQRMNRALFLIVLWSVVSYLSGICSSVLYTFEGQFQLAKSALNIQWFLNIPSIWFFSIYESYECALENNKFYRRELSKFLRNDYQSSYFKMPYYKMGGNSMYLFSTFEHSNKIEAAVTALQMKGIPRESILAVPLDRRNEQRLLFDTVHSSDASNMLALPMILGMILSLLGSIIGFQFAWGPIIWGVIGAVSGFILGLGIRLIIACVHKQRLDSGKSGKEGIVVIVQCEASQLEMAKDILWSNAAMGVAKLDPGTGA